MKRLSVVIAAVALTTAAPAPAHEVSQEWAEARAERAAHNWAWVGGYYDWELDDSCNPYRTRSRFSWGPRWIRHIHCWMATLYKVDRRGKRVCQKYVAIRYVVPLSWKVGKARFFECVDGWDYGGMDGLEPDEILANYVND